MRKQSANPSHRHNPMIEERIANDAMTIHIWDLRRIRARLKRMGLDREWPEFPAGGQ